MPLELMRLEDVQPPNRQLALVRRLAAKYDLPLAHQHASAGDSSLMRSLEGEDVHFESARSLPRRLGSSSLHRPPESLGRRSLRDSLLRDSLLSMDAAAAEADRGAAQGDEGVHAVLRDAREWVNKPFSLQKHQSG